MTAGRSARSAVAQDDQGEVVGLGRHEGADLAHDVVAQVVDAAVGRLLQRLAEARGPDISRAPFAASVMPSVYSTIMSPGATWKASSSIVPGAMSRVTPAQTPRVSSISVRPVAAR